MRTASSTLADYVVWRNHFGQTTTSGTAFGPTSAVPEPGIPVTLVIGIHLIVFRARRH